MKIKLFLISIFLVAALVFYISLSRTENSQSYVPIQNDIHEVMDRDPVDIEPSWLLFENIEYGYRLHHPPEWRVVDSSYTYEGRESITLRLYSPITTLPAVTSDPLVFSIGICKYSETFKFACNSDGNLTLSFYRPTKPGESRQEPDFVTIPEEVVINSPEYKTALKIFKTMSNIE